jgi:hypothetical protein
MAHRGRYQRAVSIVLSPLGLAQPGDQGLRRYAPIASAQRILQYCMCFCRGCADVDVAPQNDSARVLP